MAEDWYLMEQPTRMLFYRFGPITCADCGTWSPDGGYGLEALGQPGKDLCDECVLEYASAPEPRILEE